MIGNTVCTCLNDTCTCVFDIKKSSPCLAEIKKLICPTSHNIIMLLLHL